MKQRLYIIGFMGAGKSTFASHLARAWDLPWWDSDLLLEQWQGVPADSQLAADPPAFRRREARLLKELARIRCGVFSLGGGVVEGAANRQLLGKLPVLLLDPGVEECWRRVNSAPRQRPLATDYESFVSLYNKRLDLYIKCSRWQLPSRQNFGHMLAELNEIL